MGTRKFDVFSNTLLWLTFVCLAGSAVAQRAPDASGVGGTTVAVGSYALPAAVDPDVLPGVTTQIVAQVYRPAGALAGRYPVLIFLHGNHATCGRPFDPMVDPAAQRFARHIDDDCTYTTTGACPAGYLAPPGAPDFQFGVPSHLGYDYMARRMVSNGYIVVSINANLGITCGAGVAGDADLIFARGRLVLKHLVNLATWDKNGGTPGSVGVELQNHLDLSNVGLMGHSRGGEGVRAAYNLYTALLSPWPGKIPESVTFKAIFEIGPTDNTPGAAGNNIDAEGIVWNVLLPMCDGDVDNLAGVKPFDRMFAAKLNVSEVLNPTQKSTYTVWGANHNFYNTEWQTSDSAGCSGPGNSPMFPQSPGSLSQRLTSLSSLPALFRGNVGVAINTMFNRNFNPLYLIPLTVFDDSNPPVNRAYPRRVDRGFTISPSIFKTTTFEDFTQATGTNTYGFPNDASNIMINHGGVPDHDPIQRAGQIEWAMAGAKVYFQTNWSGINDPGFDTSAYKTLDIRVSRQDDPANPVGPTDFSIQLVGANGVMTRKLLLSTYTNLRGPVGGPPGAGLHPILQTARIPLTDFGNYNFIKMQVRGVRLTFDKTATGAIYVGNITLSRFFGSGIDTIVAPPPSVGIAEQLGVTPEAETPEEDDQGVEVQANAPHPVEQYAASIRSVQSVYGSRVLQGENGVEIEVTSEQPFPVRDMTVFLRIGSQDFSLSRYLNGNTHILIFTLTRAEFAAIPEGATGIVQYGRAIPDHQWVIESFSKSMLDRPIRE